MSVFAYGMMHYYTLQAAEKLASEGISVEVVDLRTLYPVDRPTILESVKKTGKALIVYEDNLTGGYGAEIAATIADGAFTDLDAPVKRLAGPDVPGVPFSHPLQEWFMPNPESPVVKGKLDDDVPVLSRIFKAAGYRTAHFGKWHVSRTAR